MGNYLNPGNDMFYKMVHSEIYVDQHNAEIHLCQQTETFWKINGS